MKGRGGTTPAGHIVCGTCYRRLDLAPKKICSNCGDLKGHRGTNSDGEPVCSKCYVALGLRPKIICSKCDKEGYCSLVIDTKPICQKCYRALDLKPKTECSNCHELKTRGGSTEDGEPVCIQCHNILELAPKFECSNCHEMKQRCGKDALGQSVCGKCYRALDLAPKIICSNCNLSRAHAGTTPDGKPVCDACYKSLKMQPKVDCVNCKEHKPRAGSSDDGEPMCATCYKPFLCNIDDCPHRSHNAKDAEIHARTHGEWKGTSIMEETTYKALIDNGFTQAWASLDPEEPPEPKTFWYNIRVFSDLVGQGGKRLECDFMVRFDESTLLWLELHGVHHYMDRQYGKFDTLANQQERDAIKRTYATAELPKRVEFSDMAFMEIPYYEFNDFIPKFIQMLASEDNDDVYSSDEESITSGTDSDSSESECNSHKRIRLDTGISQGPTIE